MQPTDLKSYDYFPHGADIGIIGRGKTIEASFEAAAMAVFAVTANLSAVRTELTVQVRFEESDPEMALVVWLNRLIAESQAAQAVFCQFQLHHKANEWMGEASGERWHRGLQPGVEVKGATLTMLSLNQTSEGWEARCVVDV